MKKVKMFLCIVSIMAANLFSITVSAAENSGELNTFAIVYNPTTGDETKIIPVIIIAVVSLILVIVASIISKRKK